MSLSRVSLKPSAVRGWRAVHSGSPSLSRRMPFTISDGWPLTTSFAHGPTPAVEPCPGNATRAGPNCTGAT